MKRKYLIVLAAAFLLIFVTAFYSYRLMEVPTGLTSDEAAFGYNAALISKTAHDQNGRFMPFFVLSIHGRDWRQPVTQYYQAAFFKLFGPSVYNLKFSSVLIAVFSAVLIFFLASKLAGQKAGLIAGFVFLTTPVVMMHAHMGLDNIMPVPFTLLWLLSLILFSKSQKPIYLVTAAISLGIGFYTYKGMRGIVPVWVILTALFQLFGGLSKKGTFKERFVELFYFGLAVLPFFAIIPLLQQKYPGAVFSGVTPSFDSVYDFLYPYFSSFDLTFLFIKGDDLLYHSTQKHGMMLLASLPFFLIGGYQAVKRRGFWLFILIAFFVTPLLYGLVGSIHRASRLMALVPFYSLITTLGILFLLEQKQKVTKGVVVVLLALMLINFADFTNYYWYTYPKISENLFGHLDSYQYFKVLADESEKRGLTPYVQLGVYDADLFFPAIYFNPLPEVIDLNNGLPPEKSLLLTTREEVPGMSNSGIDVGEELHLLTR